LDGGIVANAGSTEIFLSYVILIMTGRATWVGREFPINDSVAPGKYLHFKAPEQEDFDGSWMRGVSKADWERSVADTVIADHDCFRVVLFTVNDHLFRDAAKSAGPTLNTLEAAGFIEFQPILANAPQRLPLRASGLVLYKRSSNCLAKLPPGVH
jgi:hypothetical protein